ncbi:MAG TPA: DUF4255 domain-containing protein [Plasticicumulans sp.]|uniref:DUF4255 domain-containing protein n=1 Tax=Plasticicumulans sp. TaxID=2307179 RepID=UPI002D1DCCB5|nr:DUF4255 domain-containing protein [Plasticicumulans sp.]MBS0602490.1 DUF4255 domain-containing protein [Pseudomonadota bacterium]HMV40290.1 DUF4255 domain-containing protein [Plasticicumulans sp.]HMW31521.1 DUF4255 domain-containing protein [Plasticicumulans sp.]HMW43959.1 DUF4255 domain-containing protein [Plasticicumulans sp.]HMX54853.1 DUF4255 domain-containing protein [Plasticicumulans sp.]
MASHRGVEAAMLALEAALRREQPAELAAFAPVRLLGSADLARQDLGGLLGLYVYRVEIDPATRNRYHVPPPGSNAAVQPLLPLVLHFLLFPWVANASEELRLLGWAMQALARIAELDAARIGAFDPDWLDNERASVQPEDLSIEDLLRIWDGLPLRYRPSAAYAVRTVFVREPPQAGAGRVRTRVFGLDTETGAGAGP